MQKVSEIPSKISATLVILGSNEYYYDATEVFICIAQKGPSVTYILHLFGSKCPTVVDMMLGESNNLPLFYKSAGHYLGGKM